ncbi:MAG: hypothetical protein H8E38_13265 [SAR324 cluster bacterium]|nr:hypothetical protein [SAR324 cluster bacterium]MBL7034740.1 hypothetical protein [SAR324 cluster bacterium]
MQRFKQITLKEWLSSLSIAIVVFFLFGTVTALWNNPYFIRMTAVSEFDFVILTLEALLIGLFLGVSAPNCAVKKAGIGGVFGFLGFGCSICNKLLLLLFGSSFLLSYFEPIRHYLGTAGVLILTYALYQRWTRSLILHVKSE